MLSSTRRMSARDSRERLIDEVKKCPVLYDTRHEHHRDIDVRDRCWTDIAAKLGANSEVLKREWKILRDSLRQSLRNSRATTKSGLPCKRWGLQSRMSFLLPYMTKRKPRYGLREEIKADQEPTLEALEPEPSEGEGGGGCGDEWAAGGVLRGEEPRGAEPAHDALELFFASVCASARRLPAAQQRQLKKQVLDALLRCEAEADGSAPPAPAPAPESSTHFTMNEFKH